MQMGFLDQLDLELQKGLVNFIKTQEADKGPHTLGATAVYNARQGELSWIEQELRKKYEQYFAQKVCTMEAPCTNCKEGQG
jgi:hypothetical protein